MEEIKVGEYCRLARNQGIRKIEEIDEEGYWLDDYIADEFGEATLCLYKSELKDNVENHSENLIDLIEVGDFINNRCIEKIDYYDDHIDVAFVEDMDWYGFDDELLKGSTIVTKEQFESVSYKVEK